MNDQDREAGDPGGSHRFLPEGRLIADGAVAARERPRGPLPSGVRRLKRTIEVFPASDGALYLLRGGAEEEFVIRDPTTFDRGLLAALAGEGQPLQTLRTALSDEARQVGGSVDDALEQLANIGLLDPDPGQGTLDAEERERFDRQLLYFSEVGEPGLDPAGCQRRLGNARVLLIGCGGLGSWTASALACAGVGSLVLIDDDTVELSNLNRQILFTVADIGRPKVDAAATRLREFNPRLEVEPLRRRIGSEADVAALLGGIDVVIATADWPMYELPRWINRACVAQRVPYITAGQFPPRVRIGPWWSPGAGCLQCTERAARRTHPLYDELVAFRQRQPSTAATLGAASGIVGSALAMDCVHHLTGLAEPATHGRALILDLRTMNLEIEAVVRDPHCEVCAGV